MANRTYLASKRRGGKAGPGSKRVSVTMGGADFEALRAIADQRHQTIGGTAADLIAFALRNDAADFRFDTLLVSLKTRQEMEKGVGPIHGQHTDLDAYARGLKFAEDRK